MKQPIPKWGRLQNIADQIGLQSETHSSWLWFWGTCSKRGLTWTSGISSHLGRLDRMPRPSVNACRGKANLLRLSLGG